MEQFDRLLSSRRDALARDGEATGFPTTAETRMRTAPALVVDNEEPEEVGKPVPGTMAVLSITAVLISCVLVICRLFGAPIGILWIMPPIWGSALLVLGVALVAALREAAKDARAWVARKGL